MKESKNSLVIPGGQLKMNEAAALIRRMTEQMAGMAELVQVTNARMAAMEESLRDMRATIRTIHSDGGSPGRMASRWKWNINSCHSSRIRSGSRS